MLFGGAVFGLFAGFYYWWPKVFGRMLNERLGKWNFWLMVVGFNLTFGPMHILGLQGQPRRMYLYAGNMGFKFWNLVATVGAFILAVGVLLFLVNVVITARKPRNAPLDPWDARTLRVDDHEPAEGRTTSTPSRRCTPSTSSSTASTPRTTTATCVRCAPPRRSSPSRRRNADEHIHLPSPSYWPLVVAAGLPIIGFGLIFSYPVAVVGAGRRAARRLLRLGPRALRRRGRARRRGHAAPTRS